MDVLPPRMVEETAFITLLVIKSKQTNLANYFVVGVLLE